MSFEACERREIRSLVSRAESIDTHTLASFCAHTHAHALPLTLIVTSAAKLAEPSARGVVCSDLCVVTNLDECYHSLGTNSRA